jgi:predicted RNA-binding protein associated with RNAse of E/G family
MVFWEADGFVGWYVNLERPLVRSRVGWDYLDRELDILVAPDRSWRLLDEDEFETAQRLGVIDAEEAGSIIREAERLIGRIERWDPPFCEGLGALGARGGMAAAARATAGVGRGGLT